MTVNQCNFDRITRSLRRVRAEPTGRQARQDIALASLGFTTLCELEDDIAEAAEVGTTALRREEFRQKRAHLARAAACMDAVFSLPDLAPILGPLDKVARDAVLLSLKRCQPLVLEPLPVDPDTIRVPGLTPDLVKLILAGQHKAGWWDPWVPHQCLFEHRHAEVSPPFHAEIVETFHSDDPGWVYLCFRNSGKSTLSEEAFILRACLRLFGNALVLGFNQQRAVERLESIKHELETNERINAIFGDVRGQVWQGQKVTMSNGVCLQAVGSGQSLRGIKHFDYRPDCLLLDDIDDIGASTPLEREATKKWFFGTVLPSLASRSIIRMAATPLDQECLPVTLGKMPTWKTMVVPVKHMSGNEDAFFESWLSEQDTIVETDRHVHVSDAGIDAKRDEFRAAIHRLVAQERQETVSTHPDHPVEPGSGGSGSELHDLPHVAEEQHPAKSFDIVHSALGGQVENAEGLGPEDQTSTAPATNQKPARRLSSREAFLKKRGGQHVAESKGIEPAPPPVPTPEENELTAIERAFGFQFKR